MSSILNVNFAEVEARVEALGYEAVMELWNSIPEQVFELPNRPTPKSVLRQAIVKGDLQLRYSEVKRLLTEIRNTQEEGFEDFYFYARGQQFHYYGGDVR